MILQGPPSFEQIPASFVEKRRVDVPELQRGFQTDDPCDDLGGRK